MQYYTVKILARDLTIEFCKPRLPAYTFHTRNFNCVKLQFKPRKALDRLVHQSKLSPYWIIMDEIKKHVFLSLIWILNTLDVFLQFFGIKLVRLTKETVYNSLTPEEIEETKKPDVAVPFQLFIKVRITGAIF